MLTLCGFPISNYYNKVKLALLEKNVPFTEEVVMTKSKDDAVLSASPLSKIPFIRTPQGGLCESQAIMEYIEAAYPNPPLLPRDPFAAAKVRELSIFIDLHLELAARELYAEAFFGGKISDDTKARQRVVLEKNIAAFKRLAKFFLEFFPEFLKPLVAGMKFIVEPAQFFGQPLELTFIFNNDVFHARFQDLPHKSVIAHRRHHDKRNFHFHTLGFGKKLQPFLNIRLRVYK